MCMIASQDGPAAKAGIQAGDTLLKVQEKDAKVC